MEFTRVSIPYSSGHLFRYFEDITFHEAINKVSIPYSSGHLFRYLAGDLAPKYRGRESQSLIHQVIYSVKKGRHRMSATPFESQSLIHQVIYSVGITSGLLQGEKAEVSIPYSSGHLFRSGPGRSGT